MAPRACEESTCLVHAWTDRSSGRSHPPLRATQQGVSRHLQREPRGEEMSTRVSASIASLRPPMSAPGAAFMPATTGLSLTDTGIRMSTQGQFVLFSSGGTEGLGLACPRCSQLAVRLLPFSRCQRCRAYLFVAQPLAATPKEYRVDWMAGTVFEEEDSVWPPACPSVEIVEPKAPESKDPEVVSLSSGLTLPTLASMSSVAGVTSTQDEGTFKEMSTTTAVSVWRATIGEGHDQTSRGCGRGLPLQRVLPDWPRDVSKTCPYPPAEELNSSDFDSFSDNEEPLESLFEPEFPESQGFRGSLRKRSSRRKKRGSKCSVQASQGDGEFARVPPLPAPSPALVFAPNSVFAPMAGPTAAPMSTLIRARDTTVLSGLGDPRLLPRLSRLQRIVCREVGSRYGYEYPYLPPSLLGQVDDLRDEWCRSAVWDYLKVPVSERETPYALVCVGGRLEACLREWAWGRHIFKDRVIVKTPGKEDMIFSVMSTTTRGELLALPDPRYYR